jgi:hypothetical protein
MVEKAAVGRGRRREKKLESTRSNQTASMAELASTPLSACLSDPHERDEEVAQEGAQNSVKKGSHLGHHRLRVSVHASHDALTLHSPIASPSLTLLARCECLKRHGVGEGEGELGMDFSFSCAAKHCPPLGPPLIAQNQLTPQKTLRGL